jgi:RimJ/RimL family protein N-acetyltransferase
VRTELIDQHDDAAFAAWFTPFHAAELLRWPDDSGWTKQERLAIYRESKDHEFVLGVTFDQDGQPIACFEVSFPMKENLHLAYLEVTVSPNHRHRGIGQELLHIAEGKAQSRGREVVIARTERRSPGEQRDDRFAEQAGYSRSLEEATRELILPIDSSRLDSLEAEVAAHSSAYRTVTWLSHCPDEFVAGRVELARAMSTDAPHGDAERDVAEWTVPRLRDWERMVDGMDRDLLVGGAVENSTGNLVGFSELSVPRGSRRFVYQWDTVITSAHRGHRLGLLLKLDNLGRLFRFSPGTERIITNNATSNEPMIRVNEAMGFTLRALSTSWQKDLS